MLNKKKTEVRAVKKIGLAVLISILLSSGLFATDPQSDSLTVNLTVADEFSIKFVADEFTKNSGDLAGILGLDSVTMVEDKDNKTASPNENFYVAVQTNTLTGGIEIKLFGTGLTRYTGSLEEGQPEFTEEVIPLSVTIDDNSTSKSTTFKENAKNINLEELTHIELVDKYVESIRGIRKISWEIDLEADTSNHTAGNYVAYLTAVVSSN